MIFILTFRGKELVLTCIEIEPGRMQAVTHVTTCGTWKLANTGQSGAQRGKDWVVVTLCYPLNPPLPEAKPKVGLSR